MRDLITVSDLDRLRSDICPRDIVALVAFGASVAIGIGLLLKITR